MNRRYEYDDTEKYSVVVDGEDVPQLIQALEFRAKRHIGAVQEYEKDGDDELREQHRAKAQSLTGMANRLKAGHGVERVNVGFETTLESIMTALADSVDDVVQKWTEMAEELEEDGKDQRALERRQSAEQLQTLAEHIRGKLEARPDVDMDQYVHVDDVVSRNELARAMKTLSEQHGSRTVLDYLMVELCHVDAAEVAQIWEISEDSVMHNVRAVRNAASRSIDPDDYRTLEEFEDE